MFLIANTFAICFNKDYLLTYLQRFPRETCEELGLTVLNVEK